MRVEAQSKDIVMVLLVRMRVVEKSARGELKLEEGARGPRGAGCCS